MYIVVSLTSNSWKLDIDAGTWTVEISSNVKRQPVATMWRCHCHEGYQAMRSMRRCQLWLHRFGVCDTTSIEVRHTMIYQTLPDYITWNLERLLDIVRQFCTIPYGCVQQIQLSFLSLLTDQWRKRSLDMCSQFDGNKFFTTWVCLKKSEIPKFHGFSHHFPYFIYFPINALRLVMTWTQIWQRRPILKPSWPRPAA